MFVLAKLFSVWLAYVIIILPNEICLLMSLNYVINTIKYALNGIKYVINDVHNDTLQITLTTLMTRSCEIL